MTDSLRMIFKILIDTFDLTFRIVEIIIIIGIFLSWVPGIYNNKYYQQLRRFIDFFTNPVRKLLNKTPLGGPGVMIDFSSAITIMIISFARIYIVRFLRDLLNIFFSL